MHRRLALAVGVLACCCAASAAAAPRVFVRGFRGPQAGDIKAGVASAIRGAVDVVGSARAADAVVDGSVAKKGLNWILSVTVRDSGGKAVGGRSYPMPAPRVDRATAEKLRRDIPGLAARAGKGGGAAAKAEPEPTAHKAKAPPKKVARADERPRRGKARRSAADEADEETRPRAGKRSAADEADEETRPRKETAAQRRARLKRERAERAAEAKREKAEKARREREEKAARRGRGKGGEESPVRGQVRQAADDEATDVVGPREKRADAKAARLRREQEERERRERRLAEAKARLAQAQAEAKRERDEERRARVAADEERRAELRRAREAERRSREEEEERRAAARRRARSDEDEERRAAARRRARGDEEEDDRRRRSARDDEEREGGRLARRGEDDEAESRRRRSRDNDEGAARRSSAREEGTVRRSPERPNPPGRGPATLSAGLVMSTRHLEFSPKGQNLPIYDAPFFPAISVEGEIYPLALAGVRFGKDFGLFLRYDRVIGLTSQETDQDQASPTFGQTFNFNNQAQRVEGGIVYRLHTGSAGLAPVVRPMLGVGYQSFSVGSKSAVPEAAYTYVALGLGFYVPIGHPNFGAISTVRYHILAGLGQIGGYGSAWTAWGVDLSVGLRVYIIRSIEVSAVYLYERVEMTFQGLGPLSSERGITPPSAGSDVYQGGRLTVGYHF